MVTSASLYKRIKSTESFCHSFAAKYAGAPIHHQSRFFCPHKLLGLLYAGYNQQVRWQMQYNRAYTAYKAVTAAKQGFHSKQTTATHRALHEAESAYKAALAAAEASMQACQQQGDICPSYADWAAEQSRREEFDAKFKLERSIVQRAEAIVQHCLLELPEEQKEQLRQQAQSLAAELQPYVEDRFASVLRSLQTQLTGYPGNAAWLRWQQQRVMHLHAVLQHPEQLMEYRNMALARPDGPSLLSSGSAWQMPPCPPISQGQGCHPRPADCEYLYGHAALELNGMLLRQGHLLRVAAGQQCTACIEARAAQKQGGSSCYIYCRDHRVSW